MGWQQSGSLKAPFNESCDELVGRMVSQGCLMINARSGGHPWQGIYFNDMNNGWSNGWNPHKGVDAAIALHPCQFRGTAEFVLDQSHDFGLANGIARKARRGDVGALARQEFFFEAQNA
jgi:hypothetical protein